MVLLGICDVHLGFLLKIQIYQKNAEIEKELYNIIKLNILLSFLVAFFLPPEGYDDAG